MKEHRKLITQQEFIQIVENSPLRIEHVIVDGSWIFYDGFVPQPNNTLTFFNCQFLGQITFQNLELDYHLKFRNVDFSGSLEFAKINFKKGLSIKECNVDGSLNFRGCKASHHRDHNANYSIAIRDTDVGSNLTFDVGAGSWPCILDNGLNLTNVQVGKKGTISGYTFSQGLRIRNESSFKTGLEITRCIFREYNVAKPYGLKVTSYSVGGRFLIENCTFHQLAQQEGIELRRGSQHRLTIKDAAARNCNVLIHDQQVDRSMKLTELACKVLEVDLVKVQEVTELDAEGANMVLKDCDFQGSFKTNKPLTFSNEISLSDCAFHRQSEIQLHSTNHLSLVGLATDLLLGIVAATRDNHKAVFGNVDITDGDFSGGLALDLKEAEADKLDFTLVGGNQGVCRVVGGTVKKMEFQGLVSGKTQFTIGGVSFSELSFKNFVNKGYLLLSDCELVEEETSILKIERSRLGHADFINFNFKKIDELVIRESFLEEIQYSNADWFEPDQINKNAKGPKENVTKRDTYRQLKQAAEKNGDGVQALRFKADEFRFYQKVLNHQLKTRLQKFDSGESKRQEPGLFFKLLGDKISLLLSQYSSDYGLNWLLPFFWAAVVTVLAYYGMLAAAHPILTWKSLFVSTQSEAMWTLVGSHYHSFWQLFNPARYLSRVFAFPKDSVLTLNTTVYAIDLAHRLILGFLIYQVISAFRKYFR